MGDTNMTKTSELIDYNEVDPITEKAYNAPNKGEEGSPDEDDCTFDDKQKEEHQFKYGDSVFYEPYVTTPPRGSVEDIQQKLRATGTRLRKSLNRSERIAFSIVRVDVRYPDGIVGIVLQYVSSNRIYLCIATMRFKI